MQQRCVLIGVGGEVGGGELCGLIGTMRAT
jgi:hypothetical protein